MATKTFEELKQLAIQIRDEKTNKQNTATRVGTAMLEHINKLEQDYYDKTQTDEELKKRDDKLTELEYDNINLSGNLIDINDVRNLIDYGIDTFGEILPFKGAIISAPLRVIPGLKYVLGGFSTTNNSCIRLENKKGELVHYELTNGIYPHYIIIPEGAYYARVPIKFADQIQEGVYFSRNFMEFSKKSLADYSGVPYITDNEINNLSPHNKLNILSPNNIIDYGIDAFGSITHYKGLKVSHPISIKSHNLVNQNSNYLVDYGIDTFGEILPFKGMIVSDRFTLNENTEYTALGANFYGYTVCVRFEDNSGNKVGYHLSNTHPFDFTTPKGTTFGRICLKLANLPKTVVSVTLKDYNDIVSPNFYLLSGISDSDNRCIRFEDEQGEKKSYLTTESIYPFPFLSSQESSNIRIGSINEDMILREVGKYDFYPFENRKIALFGDSITVDYQSKIYEYFIKALTKARSVERYGLSGGNWANNLQTEQYLQPLLDSNPDVVILHSVNSHRGNVPIGTMESKPGEVNEIGALKKIFNSLIEKNKYVKIFFCTPLCYGDVKSIGYPDSFGSTSPNGLGLYLSDYINADINLCRNYGITVIPLSEKCGFRDIIESSPEKRLYTLDGVHPNYYGYRVMTRIIADYINQISYYFPFL